jgi:hypothetical protein
MPYRLDRDLNVHGPYTVKAGKLNFRTDHARLAQDLKRAQQSGSVLTVNLMSADSIAEFTGTVEAVELISNRLPACWEVTMVEHSAKRPPFQRSAGSSGRR